MFTLGLLARHLLTETGHFFLILGPKLLQLFHPLITLPFYRCKFLFQSHLLISQLLQRLFKSSPLFVLFVLYTFQFCHKRPPLLLQRGKLPNLRTTFLFEGLEGFLKLTPRLLHGEKVLLQPFSFLLTLISFLLQPEIQRIALPLQGRQFC